MSDDRRQHQRVQWVSPGRIELDDGRPPKVCLVHDLSNGGARLTALKADMVPDTFKLRLLPNRGPSPNCKVVWRSKRALGVAFLEAFPSIPRAKKNARHSQIVSDP